MDINNFLGMMSEQTASSSISKSNVEREKTVEKISLNFEGNHGRYQVLPLNNVVTDYPFVKMDNTREICIPRTFTNKEGQQQRYQDWIKILPKSAYVMRDQTGRLVSSLTSDEDRLLTEAYQIFDSLFNELDAKNNRDQSKDLVRKRNYTIFHAYCLNKWNFDDSRTPVRQNFSGLFIATAKGFVQAVEDNVNETNILEGGDNSWLEDIYGNNLKDRNGFMIFSINRQSTGYTVTVNHKAKAGNALQGVEIPAEDAELMKDPLATFLGRQAKFEEDVQPEYRRLFNANLIKEAVDFMTSQLAAIRMAKQSGTNVVDAIRATNEDALKGVDIVAQQAATNDPMLQAQQVAQPNVANIQANNDMPFQTPPAAHIDPLTSAPAQQAQQSNPFGQPAPGFGQPAGNGGFPF